MHTNIIFGTGAAFIIGILAGYIIGSNARPTTAMHDMSMSGAMDSMTMGLSGKSGDDLDKAFLDEMIVHHQGGVDMAQTLLSGTKRPELIKLGTDIVRAQTGEIGMMKELRARWFGASQ